MAHGILIFTELLLFLQCVHLYTCRLCFNFQLFSAIATDDRHPLGHIQNLYTKINCTFLAIHFSYIVQWGEHVHVLTCDPLLFVKHHVEINGIFGGHFQLYRLF